MAADKTSLVCSPQDIGCVSSQESCNSCNISCTTDMSILINHTLAFGADQSVVDYIVVLTQQMSCL